MKKVMHQTDSPSTHNQLPHASGVVTAANYWDLAIAWMRASGRPKGGHFMIRNREAAAPGLAETREQWVAWIAFFGLIELKHKFILDHGLACVPTEWPWEFSDDAMAIERNITKLVTDYERESQPAFVSAERRRELSNILCASVKGSSFPRNRKRSDYIADNRDKTHAQVPAYADKPADLSPEARAIFKEAVNAPHTLEDLELECLR